MHELGIVVHISKTLEELAQENNITDIRRVTLQIGKVSGIVPEYLVDCWKYYKKKVPQNLSNRGRKTPVLIAKNRGKNVKFE